MLKNIRKNKMTKCKFRKICRDYNKDSTLCNEDGGTWSYGRKANCWIKFYKRKLK
jgi:hypothetical protein